ncbi:hypothetical protein, partial [Lishizhenia sp.]|uniref:hypothetical protein n=1 Tax=Lishizhenia sp. TaxID=2497594 RepID=UPI00299F4569
MRLRKFSVAVVVRLLVLLVLMAFLSFVLWEKNWVATPFVLGGLIIFSTIELIYFIFRFQRHLGYALHQYRYEKEVPMQTDFPEVFKALQLIIQEKNREDQSASLQLELFKKAIQLAPSAILLCDSKGDVVVQSEGVERLLGWKLGRQLKDLDDHCPGVFELLENLNGNGQLVLEAKAFNFQLAKDVFVDKKLLNISEVEFVMYEFTSDKGSSDEFEAWANFAKVVAHEIRNGISPVKSLANSLQDEVRSIPNDE